MLCLFGVEAGPAVAFLGVAILEGSLAILLLGLECRELLAVWRGFPEDRAAGFAELPEPVRARIVGPLVDLGVQAAEGLCG